MPSAPAPIKSSAASEDPDAFDRPPASVDDSIVWSNAWAREFWAGALSPLHYSVRVAEFDLNHRDWRTVQGLREAASEPLFKHRRATAYVNSRVEAAHGATLFPRSWRAPMLGSVPPPWRDAVAGARLDPQAFLKALTGMHVLRDGAGVATWMPYVREILLDRPVEELDGPGAEALRYYDDESLVRLARSTSAYFAELNLILWFGFFIYVPWGMQSLSWMIDSWYDGEEGTSEVLQGLARGLPRPSALGRERQAIWDLGRAIGASADLRRHFEDNPGAEFFEGLDDLEGGAEFLAAYGDFIGEFGQLGSADRDFVHPRRAEDPALDYQALALSLRADASRDPGLLAARQRTAREETVDRVIASLAAKTLGGLRVTAFQAVLGYLEEFWNLRDDQRAAAERVVMSKKRTWQEVGRRLADRGVLADAADVFFLSADESVELLSGRQPLVDVSATIAERRETFRLVESGEEVPPLVLRGSEAEIQEHVDLPTAEPGDTLNGTGLSGGRVTGRVRTARRLSDLEKLRPGEILVCSSTDPGWSAAYLVAAGVVVEGGGPLSFPGRMSREHEVPAVVLAEAVRILPDGGALEIDGDLGTVTVAS